MAMVELRKLTDMIVSAEIKESSGHYAVSSRGIVLPALHFRAYARERGTALIMSLVILMILTILGITAMSTSSLEEKMSGNTQEGTRVLYRKNTILTAITTRLSWRALPVSAAQLLTTAMPCSR